MKHYQEGNNTMNVTQTNEFIARFWIGYWQARLFLIEAFPPDGHATSKLRSNA
jgi:hypothetical protein